jgi:hypothetical protein
MKTIGLLTQLVIKRQLLSHCTVYFYCHYALIFLSCKFDLSFNRNVVATVSVLQLKSISVSLVLVSTEMVEQNKKFGKYAAVKLAFIKEYDDNIGSGCW